ncbi:MAG: SDR family oxidoreductase [Bacteroidetes bacterium]|nr:SDR family oxidoreductase [Bacteroidota bacterium]
MNIIVTGASRGMGFEMVKKFAANGNHNIFAVSRNLKALHELEGLCKKVNENARVIAIGFDVATGDYERQLLGPVLNRCESIEIMVNNAGFLINKPFIEISDPEFDRVFAVNVKAPFRMVKTFFPYFSSGAHIVNIGSMGGFQGSMKFPGLSAYSASKGAVAILTESLAEELKDHGISVNCLALGSAQTEMLKEAFPNYEAPVTAEQMADFITHFALNGNKFFNGKILPVAVSIP